MKVMLLLDGLPDFPAWPGPEPWAGTIDIGFTLDDLAAAAADARAGRPAARPWIEAACQTAADPTARARRAATSLSLFCQCFPPGRRRRRRGRRRDRPLRRGLPASSRTASSTASPSGRASSRTDSASPAATSSTARCFPASCSRTASTAARFGGIESLYLAGSGAHPGGAVTGAPGYLAAQAVLEDLETL